MKSYLSVFPLLILPPVSLASGFFQSPILPRSLGSRAESDLPLTPDGNGICYQYAVQETDTCQSIAESHKMTPADIDAYNARVWRWPGCANISQGDFLCLSAGEPVMPVALAQATCGPQVPGTPRPNDYALLSSLNPCPANQCCTTEGACVPADACLAHNCISGCDVPSPAQAPADPNANTEPDKPVELTTQAEPNPTTAPQPTAKDKPPTNPTEINELPAKTAPESPSWTLAAYTWLNCDGNYLVFVGHKEDDGTCIDIHGGYSPDLSTTGVSCRYYWDGGLNSSDCDSSPSLGIHSWSLTGASCTAYHQQCDDSGRERVKITPRVGCQPNLERRPHYYMHWGSVQCQST